jgi:MipA family protein
VSLKNSVFLHMLFSLLLISMVVAPAGAVEVGAEKPTLVTSSVATPSSGKQLPLWEFGIGTAGLRVPDYRGADQSRNYLVPVPAVTYRGTWLKVDRKGARALLFDSEQVEVDVSLAGSTPTRSKDNRARQGLPNLPGTVEVGPNLNVTLAASAKDHWHLDVRFPLRTVFSLERSPKLVGATFSPNVNLDIGRVAGGWNVGLLTGPLFADRSYHGFFYDVGPAYATADRAAFRAPGGYSGWQALAATSRRFDSTWVGGFLRYDNLRGAAFQASPLVRRSSALTLGFAATWFFASSAELVNSTD